MDRPSREGLIEHYLSRQVIPDLIENGAERMVVAYPTLSEIHHQGNLPLGMRAVHRPLQSRRVRVRSTRDQRNRTRVSARWPKDGLHALRIPKLAVVLQGNIDYQCGEVVLQCEPGHIIFIPPETPHPDGRPNYLKPSDPHGSCELLFMESRVTSIHIWLSYTQQGKHKADNQIYIPGHHAKQTLHLLLEEALSEEKYTDYRRSALLLLLMTTIYNSIQRGAAISGKRIEHFRDFQSQDKQPLTQQVHEYILNNMSRKLTIDELARHVHLSRTQFTSEFRAETGKTFHQFLTECRIERAKVLLQDPVEWAIWVVSDHVGVKPTMLRRIFHEHLHMTPTEFRRWHLRNEKKRP